ncbi:hypothetical protein LSTR_LSTR003595 [Laodelphax striatellus]|uniref:Uncharacterized protein n=1 Tax=Laodelphax striatellus TaxID=195883 RepID=A0A482WKX1_LAOST|nr:hypothetical protein LSTR_LSTR003595 [Laodelphax striatellus]
MATTKYWPDSEARANIKKSNDCSDVITFWDCLFGKDRWKDLYRKRSDLCEEAGQIQRITTQKVFSKPHLYHTTTASNKPKKSENQARKTKTIFHREVYSLEIEPTNLLRYIWPWKKKDRKVKHNAEKKKNVQEERTNQNEAVKIKKRFVKRRIREEQDEELERNTNNDGLNKKDVCVHGRYLQIKQNQSWWDQVKNIFSVSFIDKVFYKNTEKKNEDNNNYNTKIASNPKNCDNSESSSDNDSFYSFDKYDLGEELNSRFLNNRSVSYTILNNSSMVMADHDHNKKQEKTVENTLYKKMDVLDRDGILRGNTSESTDENYHRNNENPVENIENGNSKAVQNSVKSHSDSFHNMLGEMYLSKKYGFLYESIQRDYCDEPNSYSMNKDSHNENRHFEMEQWNNEYLRQNGDLLCDSEEEDIKIYGVETSKNKTETHKKGVMTFTKIHSEFKMKNSKEYEEKLTKTMKSEYSDTYFRDSSFLKQFTKDGFYSFFPFSKTELQKKEENNTVFPPNPAGTRFYQVYECGELLR